MQCEMLKSCSGPDRIFFCQHQSSLMGLVLTVSNFELFILNIVSFDSLAKIIVENRRNCSLRGYESSSEFRKKYNVCVFVFSVGLSNPVEYVHFIITKTAIQINHTNKHTNNHTNKKILIFSPKNWPAGNLVVQNMLTNAIFPTVVCF